MSGCAHQCAATNGSCVCTPECVRVEVTYGLEVLYVKLCMCVFVCPPDSICLVWPGELRVEFVCASRCTPGACLCCVASQHTVQGEGCESMTFCVCSCMEAFIFSCAGGCLLVKPVFRVYILMGLCLSLFISAYLSK